ncbi:CoA transferase [Pseudomonas chlororaphis]|uniref:CoA transferase n=1 Tax=Pseudomonas chlororaphis TaxID=587753 RepID=UPI0030CBB44F
MATINTSSSGGPAPAGFRSQPPLHGLRLMGMRGEQALLPVARSLARRARILGVEVLPSEASALAGGLQACLVDEGAHEVAVQIQGWPVAAHPVSEALVQAASGITAWHRRATGVFVPLGIDYVATLSASLALLAAVAAMVGRHRSIQAHKVSLSLGGSAALAMSQYLAMAQAGQKVTQALQPGDSKPPFTSCDGQLFELEALDPLAWERFWRALGAPQAAIAAGWSPFMSRYTQACAFLPRVLFEVAALHDYEVLQRIAGESAVGVCRLRQADELLSDPQAMAWLETGPWHYRPMTTTCPVPARPHPWQQRDADLPLAGITVIEACRLIQGPLAGHLLRELGARVIKVEPPGGDPMRGMPPLAGELSAHFAAINHGKECIELDLRCEAGRTQLLELSRGADVFLHNWAPGRAERLGLTPEVFSRYSPALIFASASGTGRAPLASDPVATDFMLQAFSGIASSVRQEAGQGGALLTLVDILGGVAAAEGIVAALYARLAHGVALQLDSAMAGAAALLMAEELQKPQPAPLPADSLNTALGLPGAIPTRDGVLMVECLPNARAEGDLIALCDAQSARGDGVLLAKAIAAKFLEHDSLYWSRELARHGIACTPVALTADAVSAHPLMRGALKQEAGCLLASRPWSITS